MIRLVHHAIAELVIGHLKDGLHHPIRFLRHDRSLVNFSSQVPSESWLLLRAAFPQFRGEIRWSKTDEADAEVLVEYSRRMPFVPHLEVMQRTLYQLHVIGADAVHVYYQDKLETDDPDSSSCTRYSFDRGCLRGTLHNLHPRSRFGRNSELLSS
jgi:hypothetical protein